MEFHSWPGRGQLGKEQAMGKEKFTWATLGLRHEWDTMWTQQVAPGGLSRHPAKG